VAVKGALGEGGCYSSPREVLCGLDRSLQTLVLLVLLQSLLAVLDPPLALHATQPAQRNCSQKGGLYCLVQKVLGTEDIEAIVDGIMKKLVLLLLTCTGEFFLKL